MTSSAFGGSGSPAFGRGPACPCGSGGRYDACCGPLHRGEERAATAEQLMRSRYAAFAVQDEAYLRRTWHRSSRPRSLRLDPSLRWTGLDVVRVSGGGPGDSTGTVEFRAHYVTDGAAGIQHEVSDFVREGGDWLYLGEADRQPADLF